MAGLWNLVVGTSEERINVSLLMTETMAIGLDIKTKQQAQATLEASLGRALTGSAGTLGTELGDLNKIADTFLAGAVQSKLVYAHKLEWAVNAAELNLTDEATFRSVLGIVV